MLICAHATLISTAAINIPSPQNNAFFCCNDKFMFSSIRSEAPEQAYLPLRRNAVTL